MAASIDSVSREMAGVEFELDEQEPLVSVLLRILDDGRLEQLLALPGRNPVVAKTRRSGGQPVSVDVRELLRLWVSGLELPAIGERVLHEVGDPGFRAEQLADLVADIFETHLPWAVGLAISWANEIRGSSDLALEPLPIEVTALIKWGVDSHEAVHLLARGITSRRLAHAIVAEWSARDSGQGVMEWVRDLSLREWRTLFTPSAIEIINVLQVLSIQQTGVLHRLLSGDEVFIDLILEGDATMPEGPVEIVGIDDELPPGLGVIVDQIVVASIPTWYLADVSVLLDTGLEHTARLSNVDGAVGVSIRLAAPEAD